MARRFSTFIGLSSLGLAAATLSILAASPSTARATTSPAGIFVATANGFGSTTAGTVSQYTAAGAPVETPLVTGNGGTFGVAVSATDLYFADDDNGRVGDYTFATGTVNRSFLAVPQATGVLAIGSAVYVASQNDNTVKQYTTGGALVNDTLITGLSGPRQIAALGGFLYVANSANQTVGKYNLATGTAVNAALISGFTGVTSVAVSPDGVDLFVGDQQTGRVGEYLAATGAVVNASLITGLTPQYLAAVGTDLYVDDFAGNIDKYSLTGAAEAVPLISGLNQPLAFAVGVPEPTGLAVAVAATAVSCRRRRGRSQR